MDTTKSNENWHELKGKLKQQFGKFTAEDLMLEEGTRDEILGKLPIRLGKTKEEIQKIIS